MNRLTRWLVLSALVGLVAGATAAPVAATNGQPDQALPFRATIVMDATDMILAPGFPAEKSDFSGRCSTPSDWVISFVGRGEATHLGTFTYTASHCTRLGETIGIFSGRAEFIAANGDALRYTYGNAVFSFPDPGTACALTEATFSGGTGRFAGAWGSAQEFGCFAMSGGPMVVGLTIRSTGTLVYDASGSAG